MGRSTDLSRTHAEAAKLRRLQARIRACAKCVVAGYLERAAPVLDGDISDRVMIVGQAPGVVELTTRMPFSGRAGAELRRWLEAEIDLVRPEVIVLVGTLAIERLWGPAPLGAVVGRSKRSPSLGGALLIPLPHPSGASRWLNDPANRARLDRGLRLLARTWRDLHSA
jgi:uracil-DNA glycosylase